MFFVHYCFNLPFPLINTVYSKYGEGTSSGEPLDEGLPVITQRHPFYMDVHVMIFIGFGFLMTFLRKYGYTAVGLTFIIGSLAIQVSRQEMEEQALKILILLVLTLCTGIPAL
jgi:hypothetical protein